MQVRDIIAKKGDRVISVHPDESISEACNVLVKSGIGAVLVAEDESRLSGILSERDIVRGICDHGAMLQGLRVSDLMTPWVITCKPDEQISDVLDLMHFNNIRHIPVLENDEILGVLSMRDAVKNRLSEIDYLDDALHKVLVSL